MQTLTLALHLYIYILFFFKNPVPKPIPSLISLPYSFLSLSLPPAAISPPLFSSFPISPANSPSLFPPATALDPAAHPLPSRPSRPSRPLRLSRLQSIPQASSPSAPSASAPPTEPAQPSRRPLPRLLPLRRRHRDRLRRPTSPSLSHTASRSEPQTTAASPHHRSTAVPTPTSLSTSISTSPLHPVILPHHQHLSISAASTSPATQHHHQRLLLVAAAKPPPSPTSTQPRVLFQQQSSVAAIPHAVDAVELQQHRRCIVAQPISAVGKIPLAFVLF